MQVFILDFCLQTLYLLGVTALASKQLQICVFVFTALPGFLELLGEDGDPLLLLVNGGLLEFHLVLQYFGLRFLHLGVHGLRDILMGLSQFCFKGVLLLHCLLQQVGIGLLLHALFCELGHGSLKAVYTLLQ